MAKLVLTLAVISLLATCLQVSSAKPIVHKEDEKSENGYVDKDENEDNMIALESGDDEDYSSESGSGRGSGSGNGILILTQEEIWKQFEAYLKRHGYTLNPTEEPNHSQ